MDMRGRSDAADRLATARRTGDREATRAALYRLTVHVPLRGPDREHCLLDSAVGQFLQVFTSAEAARAAELPEIAEIRAERFIDLARRAPGVNAGVVIDPGLAAETFLPKAALPGLVDGFEADVLAQFADPDVIGVSGRRYGGFPFFAIVDGLDEQGRPRLNPTRTRPLPVSERGELLGYLEAGELLQAPLELGEDLFVPGFGKVVPGGWRTDGTRIWSDATVYYLRTYGLVPAGLQDYLRDRGPAAPEVSETDLTAAMRALGIRHSRAGRPSPFGWRWSMEKSGNQLHAIQRDEVTNWYYFDREDVVVETGPLIRGQFETARVLLFHATPERGQRFCALHDEVARHEPVEWRGEEVALFAAELAAIPGPGEEPATGFWALDDEVVDLLSDELSLEPGLWRAPRELRRAAVQAEILNAWAVRRWFEQAVELDCDVALGGN